MQAAVAAQPFQYRPPLLDEIEGNDVSLINEPAGPDNVIALPRARSLHAVLCEAMINTQALLARLEAGVHVPRDSQREVVRALYVATRNQAKALIATLELEGLE
jgi:hypothetical protein